jgi:hypothetical protein
MQTLFKNLGSFVKKLKKISLIMGCHSGLSGIFLAVSSTNACIQRDSRLVRHAEGGLAGMTSMVSIFGLRRIFHG